MSQTTPSGAAPDGYDAEAVAARAQTKDPGLPDETALLLSRRAWEHLRAGAVDAPDLARRLLAEERAAGATAANVVATAAAEYCVRHGLAP